MAERFAIVKRGYNPEEVDAYIDTMEMIIKSYKEKDAAIKNAILNAQIAADNIIKNAELGAENMKKQTAKGLEDVVIAINRQKRAFDEFQIEYTNVLKKYLREVENGDALSIHNKLDELCEFVSGLSIDNNQ